MWRKPGTPEPESPAAPEDLGHRLATLPRESTGEELRVSIDEFQGRPYLSFRVWSLGHDGSSWWPTRKGCSVRVSELAEVAKALRLAQDHFFGQPRARAKPPGLRGVATAKTRASNSMVEALPFNEFDDPDGGTA